MFGEFETDSMNVENAEASAEKKLEAKALDENLELSAKERLLHHLAASDAVICSQQRHEPNIHYEERVRLLSEFLNRNPAKFIYKYKTYLKNEHLHYFIKYINNPHVAYYIEEIQRTQNEYNIRMQKRNRRYCYLQDWKNNGRYFTEAEMKKREPLIYEQLVGKYLTEKEKYEKSLASIPTDSSFSGLLLHHLDNEEEEARKSKMKENEQDAFQEEEDDEDSEEEVMASDEVSDPPAVPEIEKNMLKDEFLSTMHSRFINGSDKDFDYSQVDTCEDYDFIEMKERDDEERYFDAESEDEEFTLIGLEIDASTTKETKNEDEEFTLIGANEVN